MSGFARFLSVLVVVASVVLVASMVLGIGTVTPKSSTNVSEITYGVTPAATAEISAPTDSPRRNAESVLYDGNTLKATFLRLYEEPGVDGVCYLQIEFENKSSQRSWVYLDNCAVNGYSVTAGAGFPTYIDPGNNSKNPFVLSYKQFDAESVEDITSIKIDIVQSNQDTLNEFFRASGITITF